MSLDGIRIVASRTAPHQVRAADALAQGLARHGIRAVRSSNEGLGTGPVAVWGWLRGAKLAREGRTALVMERGYVGDRREWTSLGWAGLNGEARFHVESDGGARWRRHFDGALQERRRDGDRVVVLGQVRGDASLEHRELDAWYACVVQRLQEELAVPVVFREHPLHRGPPWQHGTATAAGTLEDALRGAVLAVAWNSNALVDAQLAGVPTRAASRRAMAWPVCEPGGGDRESWAHALAWTQWRWDEIASGAAIPFVRAGQDAPRFCDRRFGGSREPGDCGLPRIADGIADSLPPV